MLCIFACTVWKLMKADGKHSRWSFRPLVLFTFLLLYFCTFVLCHCANSWRSSVFLFLYFCTFCAFYIFYIFAFFAFFVFFAFFCVFCVFLYYCTLYFVIALIAGAQVFFYFCIFVLCHCANSWRSSVFFTFVFLYFCTLSLC